MATVVQVSSSVNSGSSSLTVSVFRCTFPQRLGTDRPLAGLVANPMVLVGSSITSITSSPKFSFYVNDDSSGRHTNKELEDAPDICDYATAFAHLFDNLESRANTDRDDILYVCHRVVHCGDFYEPVVTPKRALPPYQMSL